jgi:hypothetical protein
MSGDLTAAEEAFVELTTRARTTGGDAYLPLLATYGLGWIQVDSRQAPGGREGLPVGAAVRNK